MGQKTLMAAVVRAPRPPRAPPVAIAAMVTQCDALCPFRGWWIRGSAVRLVAKAVLLSVALALGACAMPDTDSFKLPDSSTMFRPLSVTSFKDAPLRPVTAADIVDAEGRCAGAVASAGPTGAPGADPSGIPLVPAAIALDMTECDVVKRAGAAERVEIGTNPRNERTTVLTFIQGPRPGIYHFVGGRLASMERAPEPPPQPKPVKPARPAKPKRAAM